MIAVGVDGLGVSTAGAEAIERLGHFAADDARFDASYWNC